MVCADFYATLSYRLLAQGDGHGALRAFRAFASAALEPGALIPVDFQGLRAAGFLLTGQISTAGRELDVALKRLPGYTWGRYLRAHELHARDQCELATALLLELHAEQVLAPWVELAIADFQQTPLDAGNHRHLLDRALALRPFSWELHARQSNVCALLEDVTVALEHARVAAWLSPSLAANWVRVGFRASAAARPFEAALSLLQASECDPDDSRLDVAAAEAFYRGGDAKRAYASARVGLEKQPRNLEAAEALNRAAASVNEPARFPPYCGDLATLFALPPLRTDCGRFIFVPWDRTGHAK